MLKASKINAENEAWGKSNELAVNYCARSLKGLTAWEGLLASILSFSLLIRCLALFQFNVLWKRLYAKIQICPHPA